ncbi:MAG TPA: hypothetical protein VFA64_09610 [Hyphomicrobiaceae bacterium]|nr:hypothetical protein [Hyphomicrobiaceae bacterium]
MKPVASLLLGLALLSAGAFSAMAADCRVTGWTSGYGAAPIFSCPDEPRR